jgi:hypothetical protein
VASTAVTGWWPANAANQPGIVSTGTKALLANESGISTGIAQ